MSVTLLGNGEAKVLRGPVEGEDPKYDLFLKYRGELKLLGGQTLPNVTSRILDKDQPGNNDDPYFKGEVGGLSSTFPEYCFVVAASRYIPATYSTGGHVESRLSEEKCVSNPNHDSAPPAAAPGQPRLSYYSSGNDSLSVEIINQWFDLPEVDKAVSYELSYLNAADDAWVTLPDGDVDVSFNELYGSTGYRYWANVIFLPNQAEYSIRVRAVNPNGESEWSEARQIVRRPGGL